MEVILLQDLRHAGRRGEIIDVKPGYARNYLVPSGIALEAIPANIKIFEQQRVKLDAIHLQEVAAAEVAATQINGLRLKIAKRVTEAETLYGSVTATDVVTLLEEKGITVDRRRIDLEGGIKEVGEHEVRIELHPDVIAAVTVDVVPEE